MSIEAKEGLLDNSGKKIEEVIRSRFYRVFLQLLDGQ